MYITKWHLGRAVGAAVPNHTFKNNEPAFSNVSSLFFRLEITFYDTLQYRDTLNDSNYFG